MKITVEQLREISDLLKTDKNIIKIEISTDHSNYISLIKFTSKTQEEIACYQISNDFVVTKIFGSEEDVIKIQEIVNKYLKL